MTIDIDTLSIYERLKNVNLDDKIAKEISQILKKKEKLATKYDLQFMKTELISG